jgi:integrase
MLSTMKTTPATRKQQKLIHVGDCLYRSSVTDVYYAIFTRDGRQVKRSLKTTDPELAKRRREEYRRKVERLTADDAKTLPFAEYDKDGKLIGGVAKHWFDAVAVSLKPHTVAMYLKSVRMLARRFGSLAVRSIGLRQIEQWAAQRSAECSARTYNADLEVLRRILDYACRHGLILENPAKEITRRKLSKEKITIPTKDQFRQVLETMRSNKGKRDGEQSADLVEFLAYSGCRRAEVAGDSAYGKPPMLWGDVNFELKTFTVAGKGAGELGKSRTVPLFPPLERLLLTLKSKLPPRRALFSQMFLQVPPTGAGFYADSSWECFGSPVSLSGRNLLRGTDYNAPPSCSPPRYAAPGGGSASLGAEQRRKPYQLRLRSHEKTANFHCAETDRVRARKGAAWRISLHRRFAVPLVGVR